MGKKRAALDFYQCSAPKKCLRLTQQVVTG